MNTFLAITYSFLLSFCPQDEMGIGDVSMTPNNPTRVQYELGLDLFDCVHIYTGEETLQVVDGTIFNWFPFTQSYFVGVEYHKTFGEKLSLSSGVSHRCQHPVSAWGEQKNNFNSSRTEIYVKVSGKLDIF